MRNGTALGEQVARRSLGALGALRWVAVLAGAALAGAGCGGGSEPAVASAERVPAAKAESVGGEASTSDDVRIGEPTGAIRPARAEDLALRAFGATPVGPVHARYAAEYPIHVEIRNTSEHSITLGSLRLHVSVFRNGLLVPGCDGEPAAIPGAPNMLAPGDRMTLVQPLPCGVADPGVYDVVSVVMVGAPEGATAMDPALRFQQSISMPLRIDGDLPMYRLPVDPQRDAAR